MWSATSKLVCIQLGLLNAYNHKNKKCMIFNFGQMRQNQKVVLSPATEPVLNEGKSGSRMMWDTG